MVQLKNETVASFYAGKSVFITGGTGFLGKVLIEKLLYSCKAIDQIYVLIRKKKGQNPVERIAQLLQTELFSRLRREDPSSLNKVVPVVGDITIANLGLSEADENSITAKVSIIFHVAATVKFTERMRDALAINVEATSTVVDLCHRLRKVDAFVHVSTAYSNTDKSIVEERVYPPPAQLEEVYAFVKNRGDDQETIEELLNDRPNTYTYTKSLAEDIVLKKHGGIPTAIVRPSIVLSAFKEPIAGWLDNWNGPTAMMHASSQGTLYSTMGRASNVCDLIPVDFVTNLMIVAAACAKTNRLKVYNACSGAKNPITYGTLTKMYNDSCISRGWNKVPFPTINFVKWPILDFLLKLFLVHIPCFIVDSYQRCFGGPMYYRRIIAQLAKVEAPLTFFISHQWQFKDDNVTELISSMTPEDRETFYCDPEGIQWKPYLDDYTVGVHRYLLKKKF